MNSFAEHLAADRRLVILRLLVEARGEAGESALEKGLLMLGHRAGVDRQAVLDDLALLADEERECVVLDRYDGAGGTVTIAAITKRGVAVAEGRISVKGVASPSLGR
ncbi:hypothetical protein [Phenylobacterium sp.]|uniref:hypothetical protein n=1 Tax=Phenylobacterium sp. TaxID=1871053 RepID=UPI0035B26B0E